MKITKINSKVTFDVRSLKSAMKDRITYCDKSRFDINYKEYYNKSNVLWGFYRIR